MKRVVAFYDMFDEIPDNAHYLFSRKVEAPIEKVDDSKSAAIVSNNHETTASLAVIHIHYYEVEGMDFEDLMSSNFAKTSNLDKVKDFMQHYKIPMK